MTRRPLLWPLVPLYAAGSAVARALTRPKRLRWPVISIGSLSAGGAGKTPVVITLANMLRERGWHIDILSRGYRSRGRGSRLVDLAHPDAAGVYGDEPLVLAERTSSPVWVGPNRYASGSLAEQASAETQKHVHLLDDGFQHYALARTMDIVLATLEDLDDALLPAGNLRVGVRAFERADAVVIREEEREAIEARMKDPRLKPLLAANTLLWSVRRTLRFPAPLGVLGAGLRPVAFCAIARPENLAAMLADAGCGVAETVAFRDHSYPDIARVLEVARSLNATGLITTEKDAVKLTAADRARLEAVGPLVVVALDAQFLYPERVMRELEARLA